MFEFKNLRNQDPEIFEAIKSEISRQQNKIELIASENFVSEAVMEAMGSHLTNKYANGLVMTALTPHDIENEIYVGKNISLENQYLNNEDKKSKENSLLDELFNI